MFNRAMMAWATWAASLGPATCPIMLLGVQGCPPGREVAAFCKD